MRSLSPTFVKAAGAAGVLGGALIWAFSVGGRALPSHAAGCVLAGLCLLCAPPPGPPEAKRRAWRAGALALAALGLGELARHVLAPGSFNTPALDVGFVLLGGTLFFLDTHCAAGQYLALSAMVIGALALLGNLYGVDTPYVLSRGLGIPFSFSSLFLLLCAGMLALRPGCGWLGVLTAPGAGGSMARRLLPAALLVPALLGWLKVWGVRAGYSGAGLGPITVLALIIIFIAVILSSAEAVGREEEARRQAEEELRRLSEELLRTRDELRKLVAEKTAKLEETGAQLIQAQKMEAVGRLAGGVAHDFNNLLTAICGFTELLLLDAPAGARATEDLLEIQKAAKRGSALTRQLLAFSRRQLLQPVVLELDDVVAGVQKMLRRLIGEDISLRFLPGVGVGCVSADPGQLEQVLMNLVVNARDAMPRGGAVTLATATAELDDAFVQANPGARPGPHAVLSVSDTGSGMDAHVLAHLYEPFFTTKEQGRGTGLGLSTVYGIIKQSGGAITVESRVGQGTTFRIYLPCAPARAGVVSPSVTGALTGTETVLLAEDDGGVRELVARFLAKQGYKVLAAASGEEALRLAEGAGTIDVLLSDVVMPRMRGDELARRLLARRPGMRVVYMTGYVDERGARLSPGGLLLQKPIALETLARHLRALLDLPSA